MKVNIGPYKNWFGPYQLAEKILFWVPKERDEYGILTNADVVHKFGEWLAHGSIEPEDVVGEVKSFNRERPNTWLYKLLLWFDSKKQRKVSVHIDRWDTFSMYHTLALIVLPMLKQLNEKKHGAPYVDDKDVPPELRSTNAPALSDDDKAVGAVDANHFKRWDYVLNEMIFAFENTVDDSWEDKFTSGEYDHQSVKQEDGNYLLVQGLNHTATTDWEGRKAYAARIQNGFRLFGTYYSNLWI